MGRDSFVERLQDADVVVFVGAHPDDETLVGPLLAYCADRCRQLVVVSLTKGESGWNLAKEDLTRTLAQVRQKEFDEAVRTLGGTAVTLDYVNGTSKAHPRGLAVLDVQETAHRRWKAPGGRNGTPDAAYRRWTEEGGDPAAKLAELFREKDATLVIALEPEKGVTNHEEHVAATRAVIAAVKRCSRQSVRKLCLYYVVPSSGAPQGTERIPTSALTSAGVRDYGKVAQQSKAFYLSQFPPERIHEVPAEQCLVRATDAD